MRKQCFLVCPFGEKESSQRVWADTLHEILENALEPLDFEVTRGDLMVSVDHMAITAQVAQALSTFELCVADLGSESAFIPKVGGEAVETMLHNPNVYYEIGFRHRAALPIVHLVPRVLFDPNARHNELPFDIAQHRVVEYTRDEDRYDLMKKIRQLVTRMDQQLGGVWRPVSTTDMIEQIHRMVSDIEQRVKAGGGFSVPNAGPAGRSTFSPLGKSQFKSAMNPREGFLGAIAAGDIDQAEALLPNLVNSIQDLETVLAACGMVAASGRESGVRILMDQVERRRGAMTLDAWKTAVGALVQFYHSSDRELEGEEVVIPLIDQQVLGNPAFNLSDQDRAWYLNQKQRLYYGASLLVKDQPAEEQKYLQMALELALEVVKLRPDEPAYAFNISLIYEKLGKDGDCREYVDRYMAQATLDASHLSHAAEVYLKAGDNQKATDALVKLRDQDPQRLAILMFRSEYEQKIQKLLEQA
jgi:hypothetical protein